MAQSSQDNRNIETLLKAEAEANQRIKKAQLEKDERIRAAKVEAEREVQAFRAEQEAKFQEHVRKLGGGQQDEAAEQRQTAIDIQQIKQQFDFHNQKVAAFLIEKLFKVDVAVPDTIKATFKKGTQ